MGVPGRRACGVTVLANSGHGYMAYAPAALGFLGAVQLIAFVVVVRRPVRGRPVRSVARHGRSSSFRSSGFVLQEHLERFFDRRWVGFPWWTALEPSFWRGLVLQMPLGLAAYLVAAVLLRAASVVADVVVARTARRDGRASPGAARSLRPPAVVSCRGRRRSPAEPRIVRRLSSRG